jgi:fatty-acyl-CoA synthase
VGIWAPNCPEWIITQYATALAGIIQVNINPAYRTSELEYSLKKVGCKALILSEQFKTSNYVNILTEICPEIESSQPGRIKSKRLPEFQSAIVISNSQHKYILKLNYFLPVSIKKINILPVQTLKQRILYI